MESASITGKSIEEVAVNRIALKEALKELTPLQLVVLQLRFGCDLPQCDVADMLQITQGWVSIQERRALNTIRKFLLDE